MSLDSKRKKLSIQLLDVNSSYNSRIQFKAFDKFQIFDGLYNLISLLSTGILMISYDPEYCRIYK